MIQLALLATKVAATLEVRRYGEKLVADFQCRAWAEYGNALRVADQIERAESAFARAVTLFQQGTNTKLLGIRLLELLASLAADQRRFGLASKNLLIAQRYYSRIKVPHLVGRCLILRGLYTGYAGEPEEALRLLRRGLSLIDKQGDPALVCAAVHNELLFLVDLGCFREARKILFQSRQYLTQNGGKINQLKMQWLEGRIEAGLGNRARAAKLLDQVRVGLEEAGLGYQAALASLDLAAILLSQGEPHDAKELVFKAAKVFSALAIGREALGAVLLLQQAFELEAATVAFVEEVTAFLRKVENDPSARFDPQ